MISLTYLLKESVVSLRANPLRSALSIVGVVFGVASVVAMLAIGLGAESEIESLLAALGAQNLHIVSKDLSDSDWTRVQNFTGGLSGRDVDLVKSLYPAAAIATVGVWDVSDLNRSTVQPRLQVLGVSANFPTLLGARFVAGRSFTNFEAQRALPLVVIGEDLANEWFGPDPHKALNQELRISRSWFRIIGVLAGAAMPKNDGPGTGQATSGAPEIRLLGLGSALLTARATAAARLGPLQTLAPMERLVVKLPTTIDPIGVRKRLEASLLRLHRGAKVVDVASADEIIQQKRATTRLFSYFLLTIALISLVVGGIGIANVMLASVVERIREVGLRRALGAKRRHILWQFLTEALIICLAGGLLGGLGGQGVGLLIGTVTGWAVAFPWWGMLIAMLIATLVGLAAGAYPAVAASRISPIVALQGRP